MNNIVLFIQNNMANKVHEARYEVKIARGEYCFDQNGNPTSGYGLDSEVLAYRAQYAYDGQLTFIDASNSVNQQIEGCGMTHPASTLTSIISITTDFVKNQLGEVRSTTVQGNVFIGLVPIYNKLK